MRDTDFRGIGSTAISKQLIFSRLPTLSNFIGTFHLSFIASQVDIFSTAISVNAFIVRLTNDVLGCSFFEWDCIMFQGTV